MTIFGFFGGLLIVLLALVLLFIAISLLMSVLSGAQFVQSPSSLFAEITSLADLQPGEQFVELGSGIGSLCCFVARKTSATVVGIDISPALTLLARLRSRHLANATFILGDVRTVDLKQADVVYCYLLPPLLQSLTPRFDTELHPGARVISYGFPLPGKKPTKTIPRSASRGALYLYQY